MSRQIKAVARVQITVEVDASVWGEDCSIGQLYKQAAESGIATLYGVLNKAGCPHRVVGDVKVIGVITEAA